MKVSLTIMFDSLEEYQAYEIKKKLVPKSPTEKLVEKEEYIPPKKRGRPREYTDEERQYIKEHYGKEPTEDIAEHLGKTTKAIRGQASKLGVATGTRGGDTRKKKEEHIEPETLDIPKKDPKLEFPKVKIPKSKRKDNYVPISNLSGGSGTPLFDLGEVISKKNGTKQYKVIAECIIEYLHRKEFMTGFTIKDIRYTLKEWYKKYRKIADTTVNLYSTYYLEYFLKTNLIERTSEFKNATHICKSNITYQLVSKKTIEKAELHGQPGRIDKLIDDIYAYHEKHNQFQELDINDVNEFYDYTNKKGSFKKEKYFTVLVELKKAGAAKQTGRMTFDMLEKRNMAKMKLHEYYHRRGMKEESKCNFIGKVK